MARCDEFGDAGLLLDLRAELARLVERLCLAAEEVMENKGKE